MTSGEDGGCCLISHIATAGGNRGTAATLLIWAVVTEQFLLGLSLVLFILQLRHS